MRAELIVRLLPEVYQRAAAPNTPLSTLLEVMEQLHAPVETMLDELPRYFDPQRAPEAFVAYLARWVDLDRWLDGPDAVFATGTGRLRQLVAAATELSQTRGTAAGLCHALEWATGVRGVQVVEAEEPFHVTVLLPAAAAAHRALVTRIVQQDKPAHVTAAVVFEDAGTAPAAAPDAPVPDTPAPDTPAPSP